MSLNLLAILCIVQSRIPSVFFAARAHGWLIFIVVSTRTSRTLSAELLYSCVLPSLYWRLGLFLPSCRTSCYSLLNFTELLSACISSLSRSLRMAAWPPGVSVTLPSFVICNLSCRRGRVLPGGYAVPCRGRWCLLCCALGHSTGWGSQWRQCGSRLGLTFQLQNMSFFITVAISHVSPENVK